MSFAGEFPDMYANMKREDRDTRALIGSDQASRQSAGCREQTSSAQQPNQKRGRFRPAPSVGGRARHVHVNITAASRMSNLRHFVTSALAKWVAALKLRDEALRLNSPSLRLRCGEHSADSDVIARC
jgi:hypothetical protein